MKYLRFLNKLSDVLIIPTAIGGACIVIFKDTLNTLKYAQALRFLVVMMGIIIVVGALVKNKNEKNN
ncbi:MAG: hypothetical protein FWH23_03620 [Bacteroidales bacterium]|nr:hypothetical protein [Bacteroidales bacterium]